MNLRKERHEDRGISQEALDAIANYNGPVTVCPLCKHAIDFAELEIERRKRGDNGWLSRKETSHKARQRQLRFERAKKVANEAQKAPRPKLYRVSDDEFLTHVSAEWMTTRQVAENAGLCLSATLKRLTRLEGRGLVEGVKAPQGQPKTWRNVGAKA